VQRLIIQDRALRIAPSTASVKGADHNIGGSCRARLAGRQRTADRQEVGVNDPSAQRPGALPLPPDRLAREALTITSGSPQAAATPGIDSSPAAIQRPRPTPSARGVGALRGCRRNQTRRPEIGSTRSRQDVLPRVLRGRRYPAAITTGAAAGHETDCRGSYSSSAATTSMASAAIAPSGGAAVDGAIPLRHLVIGPQRNHLGHISSGLVIWSV